MQQRPFLSSAKVNRTTSAFLSAHQVINWIISSFSVELSESYFESICTALRGRVKEMSLY